MDMEGTDSRKIAKMVELARYVEAHADETISLADLAQRGGYSPSHLQRVFKSVFGVSPKAYQAALRLRSFKDQLKKGADVSRATFDAGYGSSSRVYEGAARRIGMTPSAYRRGGAGEEISYACRTTCLGPLMMAATDRGVCFASFADREDDLLGQLRAEFPRAAMRPSETGDSPQLDGWIAALDEHLSGARPRPEIPLDLRGTAFQIIVWRFLLTIPRGQVVSYRDVARAVGRPKAVRAAAGACARNRIAVLVPCHRVLRSDGGLGGYRFGVERKSALLGAEQGGGAGLLSP